MIDQKIVDDWQRAKGIIEQWLKEIVPGLNASGFDKNASALIARLAHADMLIVSSDLVKES